MKRLLLGLAALLLSLGVSAQFRYGPALGIDISNLNFKQDLFTVDKSVGYSGGLMAEMMFPGIGFGIDMGLLYEQRGATCNLGQRVIWSSQGYGRERIWLHNLSIPLHLRFKWTRMNGLEDYWAPFIFGGPDFSFLLAHGKCEAMRYSGGDIGLTVGLGFEIKKRWQVAASHTWGMTYAAKTALLTDMSARSRTWDVRVAYLF